MKRFLGIAQLRRTGRTAVLSEKINEYDLSLFIETDKDSGLYRKYEETHYQRAYTLEEMKELIRKSGLEFVTAYDAFSKNAPMDTSERIYVIAREQGK